MFGEILGTSLKLTQPISTPENRPGKRPKRNDRLPPPPIHFQGRTVSFGECRLDSIIFLEKLGP